MAQWFRKVKAGLVKAEITEFVGEEGNIFFNIATGELRLSDGVTPGGLPIGGGGGGGPSLITVEENGVTKGSVTRLNFANSTVTVSGTTANIIAPSGGGGGSGTLNEISTITASGTFLDRVFLPDSIRFDNQVFTVTDIGSGDVKIGITGGLGNLDGGTHDTEYGGLDVIDGGGI